MYAWQLSVRQRASSAPRVCVGCIWVLPQRSEQLSLPHRGIGAKKGDKAPNLRTRSGCAWGQGFTCVVLCCVVLCCVVLCCAVWLFTGV